MSSPQMKKNNKKKAPFRVKEGRWKYAEEEVLAMKREKPKKVKHGNRVKCAEDNSSKAYLQQFCG